MAGTIDAVVRGAARRALIRGLPIVFGLLLPTGCATSGANTAGGFRETNHANLSRLTLGMSRAQVLSIMGTGSLERPVGTEGAGGARTERDTLGVTQVQLPVGGARAPALYNPMWSATFEAGDTSWEVLYYYVRMVADDNRVTADEVAPVVLANGYLSGIGWPYWRETARAEGIPLDDEAPPET